MVRKEFAGLKNMTLKRFMSPGRKDVIYHLYDRAVIDLGIAKAGAQGELDRMRSEINEISARYAKLIDEIKKAEETLTLVRQEISDTIDRGINNISALGSEKQTSEIAAVNVKVKFTELEKYLSVLESKITESKEGITALNEKSFLARKTLDNLKDEITELVQSKLTVQYEIEALCELKNDMVSGNAKREGVLQYLEEKEKFLNRKEADLIKYEKRVEKMRKEINNNNEMKFK